MDTHLKIKFNGIAKRIRWFMPAVDKFICLDKIIRESFPELVEIETGSIPIRITYFDDEEDEITIDCDESLEMLAALSKQSGTTSTSPSILSVSVALTKLKPIFSETQPSESTSGSNNVYAGLSNILASIATANGDLSRARNIQEVSQAFVSAAIPVATTAINAINQGVRNHSGNCNRAFRGGKTTQSSKSEAANENPKEPVIHHNITCDGCDMGPIMGIRYKSAVVQNYDLCETCESGAHGLEHGPYLKIRKPSECPEMLICVINDGFGINYGHRGQFNCYGGGRGRRWRNHHHRGNQNQQGPGTTCRGQTFASNEPVNEPNLDVNLQEAIGASLNPEIKNNLVNDSSTVIASEVIPVAETVNNSSTVEASTESSSIILDVPPEDDDETVIDNETQEKSQSYDGFEILERIPGLASQMTTSSPNSKQYENSVLPSTGEIEKRKRAKRWEVELTHLAEMGFSNFGKNMDLLDRFVGEPGQGGMEEVLNVLLNE